MLFLLRCNTFNVGTVLRFYISLIWLSFKSKKTIESSMILISISKLFYCDAMLTSLIYIILKIMVNEIITTHSTITFINFIFAIVVYDNIHTLGIYLN